MPSPPAHQSSGSEGTPELAAVDSRKRKRMLSNRESARRSRARKRQMLDDAMRKCAQLGDENGLIAMQTEILVQLYVNMDSENTVLRTQVMELAEKLWSLNSVLQFVEEFSRMEMDIPEIPDPLLLPWQLPCPVQPIFAATADMFQF